MSEKEEEFRRFVEKVVDHINNYVVTQWGDHPDEMVEGFDFQDIRTSLDRYVKRIDRGARGEEEEFRDALKIAHYACYLYTKLEEKYGDRGVAF